MSKKIVVYEGESLKHGARIALKNRLYISGWSLSYHLKDITASGTIHHNKKIAIVYVEDTPVAVSLKEYDSLQAFCRKSERRKGYASDAVNAIKSSTDRNAGDGIGGANIFWSNLGIRR